MSSSAYSYFNPNNYQQILPSFESVNAFDLRMLPSYALSGTQLMTYVLVGITAVTLGYITIKGEGETEKEREARKAADEAKEKQREAESKQREAEAELAEKEKEKAAENKTGGKPKKNKTKSKRMLKKRK